MPALAHPGSDVREFMHMLDPIKAFSEEVLRIRCNETMQAKRSEIRGTLSRRWRRSGQSQGRYSHPERVVRRRAAGVRLGVKAQIDEVMECKIVLHASACIKR